MNMIRHQTICKDVASTYRSSQVFRWTGVKARQNLDELSIVFIILEDVLTVYTTQHYVINTCSAQSSWLSWHNIVIIICRYNTERSRLLWKVGQVPVPMTRRCYVIVVYICSAKLLIIYETAKFFIDNFNQLCEWRNAACARCLCIKHSLIVVCYACIAFE